MSERFHVTADQADESDNRLRLRKERAIRWVDIAAYAVIFTSGLFVLIQPPASVVGLLPPYLIHAWSVLLLISGGSGFLGRFTRLWAVEAPGAFAGAFGAALYVLVLIGSTITGQVTGAVASTFVACMSLLMVRRYIELQLFTTDPGDRTFSDRIVALLRRRTGDSIISDMK